MVGADLWSPVVVGVSFCYNKANESNKTRICEATATVRKISASRSFYLLHSIG